MFYIERFEQDWRAANCSRTSDAAVESRSSAIRTDLAAKSAFVELSRSVWLITWIHQVSSCEGIENSVADPAFVAVSLWLRRAKIGSASATIEKPIASDMGALVTAQIFEKGHGVPGSTGTLGLVDRQGGRRAWFLIVRRNGGPNCPADGALCETRRGDRHMLKLGQAKSIRIAWNTASSILSAKWGRFAAGNASQQR